MRHRHGSRSALLAAAIATVTLAATTAPAGAAAPVINDPFFHYDGQTPLAQIAPGTVLKQRTVKYHLGDLVLPNDVVQLQYRSTSVTGKPTINVTSIIKPVSSNGTPRVVAYGSFYDSLDPRDQPSLAIAGQGNPELGGALVNVETLLLLPLLDAGYTLAIADTEGQQAAFAAGPEYGFNTLDGIRAAFNAPATGLTGGTKVALMGYSGGAIATEWAAELAPEYAPDVNARLIGAAMGGVLVHPAHNLFYIEGSQIWAGVMPMALVGIARAFDLDLSQYMSPYGRQLYDTKQDASIVDALFQYPGLTWSQIVSAKWPAPENIEIFVNTANKLIMGTWGTPTVPMMVYQGAHGEDEGTPADPVYGSGDGVMVAGDVRSLVRQYCDAGLRILHKQFDDKSHVTAAIPWREDVIGWLADRFAGKQAPENCADVKPGNSLAKLAYTPSPSLNPPLPPNTDEPPAANPAKETQGTPDLAPVSRAGGGQQAVQPSGDTTAQSVTSAARAKIVRVRAKGRVVRIVVRCTGEQGTICLIRSKLTTTTRGLKVALGTGQAAIPAGAQRTVTVRSGALAKRLLRNRGSLTVTLSTVQTADTTSRSLGRRTAKLR